MENGLISYNHRAVSQVVRFLVTGGIGISVNLSTFYLLLQKAQVPYVAASVLALSLSTVVGFILQKYWTFRASEGQDGQRETLWQFMAYAGIAVLNLGIDAGVVYSMVDLLLLNKFLAQATAAAVVALWSFFIYKNLLFAERR